LIDSTAVVSADAQLGTGVAIGPFCVIGIDGIGSVLLIGSDAVIRSHSVLYRGTNIGKQFHCGHGALVRDGCSIGSSVSVGSGTIVEHHVELGDGVRLHSGCFIPERSVLEEGAWIGPRAVLTNARYPNRTDTKDRLEGVFVGKGAVVGAGAVLLPGVQIGAGAIVGAGAVVTRDVPASSTVVGNPARIVGR
jgi:acetyltransferase-like isoleucine patch superfamily enzyme